MKGGVGYKLGNKAQNCKFGGGWGRQVTRVGYKGIRVKPPYHQGRRQAGLPTGPVTTTNNNRITE